MQSNAHQAPALSHSNHGTIGEGHAPGNYIIDAYNTRFGYYTTSEGIGLLTDHDFKNGMLNTTSDDVPLTLTYPY